MPVPDTPEIWAFKTDNILNLRFMLSFLTMICPREFFITAGSIKQIFNEKNDGQELQILEEILFQVKEFFINHNLDGKNLFRALSKQAQIYFCQVNKQVIYQNLSPDFNIGLNREELLWKVFELIFVVSFFCKEETSLTKCLFDKAINNLSKSSYHSAASESASLNHNPIDHNYKLAAQTTLGSSQVCVEVNSLLTKSVIQIIADVLKQFTAVLPDQ